jgi:chromosome segregation ATPase
MSDLLSIYEKNLRKNQDGINKNVDKVYDYLSNKVTKEFNINEIMEDINNLIEEQKGNIKKIEVEISSSTKKEDQDGYNSKITSYKQSLEMNKKKYRELEEKINLKEASLILTDQNQLKGNLINNEQIAYASNQKIQQAKRALAEAEDIGNKIMVDMEKQTNVMKNTNNRLKGMNSELDESNNILNKMKSRIKKNKNVIKYLGIILFIILALVCIYKIYKSLKGKKK